MDTSTRERDIVKQVIQRYAQFKPSHGDIRLDTVFDDTQNRYALMQVGWDRGRRVRGNLIYVTLSEGKVWVEYDGMEQGITKDLIAAGIRQSELFWHFYLKSKPLQRLKLCRSLNQLSGEAVWHVLRQQRGFVVFSRRIHSIEFHLATRQCTPEDALQLDLVHQQAKTPSSLLLW
jgi:hypothetical protein